MRSLFSSVKALFRPRHSDSNILFLSRCFDIEIRDPEQYRLALVHRSSSLEEDNERLELLGDAVLDLVVAEHLYRNFPELNEGELTKLKSKLISREQLNKIGHQIGLVDNLELTKQKDLESSLVIGNVLEAIFGAIYLERGFEDACRAGNKMFAKTCDIPNLLENLHDPKSLLLEWSQKEKKQVRIKVRPTEDDRFEASIHIGERLISSGEGRSKKRAEKAAAKKALQVIETEE